MIKFWFAHVFRNPKLRHPSLLLLHQPKYQIRIQIFIFLEIAQPSCVRLRNIKNSIIFKSVQSNG